MTDTPPPDDPLAYQEWIHQLEQKWQSGLIPDPQAVAVILINSRRQVLLQLRDKHPNIAFANAWTLPGGVVEPGETPEQAAHRELVEETGLRLNLSHWKAYKRKPEDRLFTIEQHIYLGRTNKEINEMTLGEGQALQYFRHAELPSLPIAFGFDILLNEFFEQDKE